MVKSSQLSIYGLALINAMLANRYYKVHKNTTLNEKFNIKPTEHTPQGTIQIPIFPRPKLFVLGVGGTPYIDNVNSYKYSQHSVLDAALFKHIPFVIRPINDDLTDTQREKYRLRKTILVKGDEYYAYYAKVCDLIDYRNYNFLVNKVEGNDILSIMNFDSDRYLNPQPVIKPSDPKVVTEVNSVINRFKFEFRLIEEEQKELKNVLKVLDMEDVAKITELGICHGYDIPTTYGYESLDTQITYFVDIDLDVALDLNSTSRFIRNIELGGSEPFYNILP
jgi:PHIKZ139